METAHYQTSSFESPHNNVHNSVGCSNGTMYDLNWSAFDPIFMLHHANLDRLIAVWQAIYPDSKVFNITDFEDALYGTAAGDVSADTPLKPFYNQDGSFHTSNSVRNISTFGYTYPELQLSNAENTYINPDDLADFVRLKVNSLYSGEPVSYSTTRRFMSKRSLQSRRPPSRKTWSVAISVEKAELPLPATVRCYVDNSLVGKMALLAVPATGITHSTIPLDAALSAASLDLACEDDVTQYLDQKLRFEVQEGDGTPIQINSMPSLELIVQDQDFTPRQSDREFPTYGATNRHPWKVGGSGERVRGLV
ncbi:Polyphenol oxidase 1 [Cytospora mali]|uniref:tyrosinase n=1 Tax=Cytospora mali TaxID=578113 RepID=A0A194UMR4_CYTMA|nr:Polyphenol oxidase 1 [Valsa mali var. pyri (nom. inval.)]